MELITAVCCETARDKFSPIWFNDDARLKQWQIDDAHGGSIGPIFFCPFCGTKLPEDGGRA